MLNPKKLDISSAQNLIEVQSILWYEQNYLYCDISYFTLLLIQYDEEMCKDWRRCLWGGV